MNNKSSNLNIRLYISFRMDILRSYLLIRSLKLLIRMKSIVCVKPIGRVVDEDGRASSVLKEWKYLKRN